MLKTARTTRAHGRDIQIWPDQSVHFSRWDGPNVIVGHVLSTTLTSRKRLSVFTYRPGVSIHVLDDFTTMIHIKEA